MSTEQKMLAQIRRDSTILRIAKTIVELGRQVERLNRSLMEMKYERPRHQHFRQDKGPACWAPAWEVCDTIVSDLSDWWGVQECNDISKQVNEILERR